MQTKEFYKIIIIDDQPLFRESLQIFLEKELGHKVIGQAKNGEEFLSLSNILEADLILMDIEMPGLNGLEISRQALWQFNQLKIIAITMYRDKVYLKNLIESGIKGFVHKTGIYTDIQEAMHNVFMNKLHFPQDLLLH